MPNEMKFYVGGSVGTPELLQASSLEHQFPWLSSERGSDLGLSPRLVQEICDALAAVERGEIEDLGDFSQYLDADEDPSEA